MSALQPTAFVTLSTHHGPLLVNRHDYLVSASGGGGGVGYELFSASQFEMTEIAMMKRLLDFRRQYRGQGVVALDVGANIGVHAVELARHMHGWGSTISIEAQERIFYALARNITMNNAFNARAIWAAVDRTCGSIDIPCLDYLRPASFGSFEIRPAVRHQYIGQDVDYVSGEMLRTPSITIDSLDLKRLDFIKIDIEGMELAALEGAAETISRERPTIFVEYVKSNVGDLVSTLRSHGYVIGQLSGNFIAIHHDNPESQVVFKAEA
jgi:FkbM family methyltransferase